MRITSAILRFIRRKRDSKRELQRPARARLYIDGHFLGEVESFKLSPRDWETVVDAIENPPPPSEAMQAAARWYQVVMGEDNMWRFEDDEDEDDCDNLKCSGYCPNGECECPELDYESEEYGGDGWEDDLDSGDDEMDEDEAMDSTDVNESGEGYEAPHPSPLAHAQEPLFVPGCTCFACLSDRLGY